MTRFIPTLVLLAAVAGLSSSPAHASDVNVSLGFGTHHHGYYYPYSTVYEYDPYVTYYDDTGYYPYAYDTYGYYRPSYNWNTSVNWYSGWHGSHDSDRAYWRGRETGYRYGRSSAINSGTRSSASFHSGGNRGHR